MPGDTSSIHDIQSALKARGFDPGPIDGAFGPRTRAAVLAALAKLPTAPAVVAVAEQYTFGAGSQVRLATCDQRLQHVMDAALATAPMDFLVTCGHRNKADQDAAVAAGTSRARWPTSKHNSLPSKAVDIAPWIGGAIPWADTHSFIELGEHVMATAARLGVPLRWGRYFTGLVDLPHFELAED